MVAISNEGAAMELIDFIRQTIVQSYEGMQEGEYDPWDEEENGVSHIDNELGFLDQLREDPELGEALKSEYADLNNVEECKAIVISRGGAYIRQALAFMRAGGTSNPDHFTLRATKSVPLIQAYLASLQ